MKTSKILGICCFIFTMMLAMLTAASWAEEEVTISVAEVWKGKAQFDDPRPYLKEGPLAYKNFLSPDVYASLTYDVKKMKPTWAEALGFSATDEVGKIAPEIKPGTYSYRDKEKYPGLKKLMTPDWYKRFKPGAPPFAGNVPEIKVVPTRQYYWALPIAEATKKYAGQTKLDDQGYIVADTYVAGYPFPKPSGQFKAQQIMYNWEKHYMMWESFVAIGSSVGISKKLKIDKDAANDWYGLRLNGRVQIKPYGVFDARAKLRGEFKADLLTWVAPRDSYGNAFSIISYLDRDTWDFFLIYVNALRRIRKMSGSDTQDSLGGSDNIYEDKAGFAQKLSPNRYPHKFKVIAEREYLVPFSTLDGAQYVTSPERLFELRNMDWERRPTYVVELTQMDKNFVYGKRILYFDKETFLLYRADNFDQKGRLYRTLDTMYVFVPEMGMYVPGIVINHDRLETHSTLIWYYAIPAPFIGRNHVNLKAVVGKGK